MPARSNEFQRLVFLAKKVLAESDATVTESKMLPRRVIELTVDKVVGEVPASGDLAAEHVAFRLDNLAYDEDDHPCGSIGDMVNAFAGDSRAAQIFINADESHRFFSIESGTPRLGPNRGRAYVQKLVPVRMRPLDTLIITGRCRILKERVRTQRATLGPTRIIWGSAELRETKATMVVVEEDGEGPRIGLHLNQRDTPDAKSGEAFARDSDDAR